MIPGKIVLLIPKLATSHDGELVAVRDAIERVLTAAGLDWHDLAAACNSSTVAIPQSGNSKSFGDLARAVRDLDHGRLSARERSFVIEMCAYGFGFRPSARQAHWMTAIYDRLAGVVAA